MKRNFILMCLAALLVNFLTAQELTKGEKKRLKEEIKTYSKDLAGYKAKMQDIRTTLDSNDAEIKRLKDDVAFSLTQQAELENQKTDYATQLAKCNEEKAALQSNPGSGQPGFGGMDNLPKQGTVYKVQFGFYKEFSITKYFDQPRYIGYEEENGINRYIISSFEDESVAMGFVQDVRKMGVRDAFVAKYIDGQRVYEWSKNPKYRGKPVPTSLEEALEMDKKGKKGKKNN